MWAGTRYKELLLLGSLLLLLGLGLACGGDKSEDDVDAQASTGAADESSATQSPDSEAAAPSAAAVADGSELDARKDFFQELESPDGLDSVVTQSSIAIMARTRIDALVTVNQDPVEPDMDGRFSHEVQLNLGHHLVELLASTSEGEQKALILAVIYTP